MSDLPTLNVPDADLRDLSTGGPFRAFTIANEDLIHTDRIGPTTAYVPASRVADLEAQLAKERERSGDAEARYTTSIRAHEATTPSATPSAPTSRA